MRAPRLATLAPVALGLLVAVGIARSLAAADVPTAAPHPARTAAAPARSPAPPAKVKAAVVATAEAAAPGERPGSLAGTEVDGALAVGADGHLVVGPAVITLFDYFFSATGEESDAAIRARIAAYAREHLTDPALGEALALLDHYSAYRDAARTLRAEDTASPEDRWEMIRRLRHEHFGEAAPALFGNEERGAAVAMEKSRISKDPTLSAEEREDQIAAAEEKLSEADRNARKQAGAVLQLRADEQALRAAGADEAEIQRFRSGTLGPEAADRLGTLDRERAAWKARIAAFETERDTRCAKAADPAGCVTALLQGSFDEREQVRVRAITGAKAAAAK